MKKCEGETRWNGVCNNDDTHRVCARISDSDTFWKATGQDNWCNGGRCTPNWCICKWALNDWVKKVGCDNVSIDCGATDVQNVLRSRSLPYAQACIRQKCGSGQQQPSSTDLDNASVPFVLALSLVAQIFCASFCYYGCTSLNDKRRANKCLLSRYLKNFFENRSREWITYDKKKHRRIV